MNIKPCLLLPLALCCSIFPSFAFSQPLRIQVEISAIATGSLGNRNFTNKVVSIVGCGSIDDVFMSGNSYLLREEFSASVFIEDIGTADFVDELQAVSNTNSELGGFGNTSSGSGLIFVSNEAFADFDLMSSIDPLTGQAIITIGIPHATDAGNFRLLSVSGPATYFTALYQPGDCAAAIGDMNGDGLVDLLDVAPFVDALTAGEFPCQADINQDGVFDLLDVSPFVTLLTGG